MPNQNTMARSVTVLPLLLASLVHLPIAASEPTANRITVVYNHIRADTAPELQPGGGFAAFVEFNGKTILFDTGGQADTLLQNLRELKGDATGIDAVVISHNHWDHVYGLPGVMSATSVRPKIYVPESSRDAILQQNPRATIAAVDSPTQIMPKVWVTGPMKLEYRGGALTEQALVLEHEDALFVLVGCSHPGIVDVVERVKELFEDRKIRFVGGGFHLRSSPQDEIESISSRLQHNGVEHLAPSHCTGDGAMDVFRQDWGKNYVSFDLGDSFMF
jgi:7,8-dihydropterin-6-yl-methyl-4-(beta-D-ribofuranosyl)aminobenzene 5'-phosphate synthase